MSIIYYFTFLNFYSTLFWSKSAKSLPIEQDGIYTDILHGVISTGYFIEVKVLTYQIWIGIKYETELKQRVAVKKCGALTQKKGW